MKWNPKIAKELVKLYIIGLNNLRFEKATDAYIICHG